MTIANLLAANALREEARLRRRAAIRTFACERPGVTAKEIATALSLSPYTVTRDLAAIKREWRKKDKGASK